MPEADKINQDLVAGIDSSGKLPAIYEQAGNAFLILGGILFFLFAYWFSVYIISNSSPEDDNFRAKKLSGYKISSDRKNKGRLDISGLVVSR